MGIKDNLNLIALASLCGAAFTMSFSTATPNILLGIAEFICIYKLYKNRGLCRVFTPRLAFLMLVFWTCLCVSGILGVDLKESAKEIWKVYINRMIPFFVTLFTASFIKKEKFEYVLWASCGSVFVTSIAAIWQFMHGVARPVGLTGHWIHLGSFYCLVIPIILIVVLDGSLLETVWKKTIFYIMSSVCFIGFLVNNTRGAWLAVFLIAIMIVLLLGKNNYKVLTVGALTLCLFVGIIYTVPAFNARAKSTIRGITDNRAIKGASDERWFIWRSSVEMIKDSPMLGYGPGTFKKIYNEKYIMKDAWHAGLTHAHNLFLNIAAESGVVALLSFISIYLYILCQGVCIYFKDKSIYGLMIISVVLSILLNGFTEFNSIIFKISWMLIAWAYMMYRKECAQARFAL